MATNFPGSLDSLTNPLAGDGLDSPSHADQHANVNDAVEALEAKVGADSSAVTTSHDYKIAQLEAKSPTITLSGDASGSATLTNLGDATLSVTVADDSHNHTIANVDGLQTALDGKLSLGGTVTTSNITTFQSNSNMATTSGGQGALQIYSPTANTDAFITFHVAGDYATYFGLDGGINDLAVGGWSMGSTPNRIYHEGNFSPGLTLINDTHVGSGVTSVTISNVFSSTYDNYRIVIDQMDATAAGSVLGLQMDTYSGAVYDEGGYYVIFSSGTSGFFSGYGATYFGCGYLDPNYVTCAVIDVIGPNIARHTKFMSVSSGDNVQRSLAGRLRYNVAHTGFRILPSSGTLTGGSIRTYGYGGT